MSEAVDKLKEMALKVIDKRKGFGTDEKEEAKAAPAVPVGEGRIILPGDPRAHGGILVPKEGSRIAVPRPVNPDGSPIGGRPLGGPNKPPEEGRVGVGHNKDVQKVILQFPKPIANLVLDPLPAIEIGNAMVRNAHLVMRANKQQAPMTHGPGKKKKKKKKGKRGKKIG